MAAYSIKLERPAQNVLFSNGNIFVGLGNGSLLYYTYSEGMLNILYTFISYNVVLYNRKEFP